MLYKSDTTFRNFLINVREHLDKDWDFVMVISGVTGAGKSIFLLQLFEEWYKFILEKEFGDLRVLPNNITGDIKQWVKNLRELDDFDINAYDEGLLTMDSKDHMTKEQKEVKKIFNTIRSSKKLFNVILVQDWFSLTKYFREQRANTLIYINRRGEYKLYTKEDLKYLNGYNERRAVKSMTLAYPYHTNNFPDYKGVLRKPYYDYINELKQHALEESLNVIQNVKKVDVATAIIPDVAKLKDQGFTYKQIKEELGVSINAVCKAVSLINSNKK